MPQILFTGWQDLSYRRIRNLHFNLCSRWLNLRLDICFLMHWGRVTHICVSKLTIIGSDNGLLLSHYLNQCWNVVNSNLRNKLQWNLKRNSCIFIQENAFQNVVCEMASILCRPQCVNAFGTITFSVPQMIKYVSMLPKIYSSYIILSCLDKIVSILTVNIPILNAARSSSATMLFWL